MRGLVSEENLMLGSLGWKVTKGQDAGIAFQAYATPNNVSHGEELSFHGSSDGGEVSCKIQIYRMGWYAGTGARKLYQSPVVSVGSHGTWSKKTGWINVENITDKVVDFKLHVYEKIKREVKNLI